MLNKLLKKSLVILAISIVFIFCDRDIGLVSEKNLSLSNLADNMITVPGGSFVMGATNKQLIDNGDNYSVWWSPATLQVTLSSYKICKYEVTQQLWLDVMGTNPSHFKGNLQRPVDSASWDDCQIFITKLNQLTAANYRLPTEA